MLPIPAMSGRFTRRMWHGSSSVRRTAVLRPARGRSSSPCPSWPRASAISSSRTMWTSWLRSTRGSMSKRASASTVSSLMWCWAATGLPSGCAICFMTSCWRTPTSTTATRASAWLLRRYFRRCPRPQTGAITSSPATKRVTPVSSPWTFPHTRTALRSSAGTASCRTSHGKPCCAAPSIRSKPKASFARRCKREENYGNSFEKLWPRKGQCVF